MLLLNCRLEWTSDNKGIRVVIVGDMFADVVDEKGSNGTSAGAAHTMSSFSLSSAEFVIVIGE